MKLSGITEALQGTETFGDTLAELTVELTPAEARTLAAFFLHVAHEMDAAREFGHLHLEDFDKNLFRNVHVTAFRLDDSPPH